MQLSKHHAQQIGFIQQQNLPYTVQLTFSIRSYICWYVSASFFSRAYNGKTGLGLTRWNKALVVFLRVYTRG